MPVRTSATTTIANSTGGVSRRRVTGRLIGSHFEGAGPAPAWMQTVRGNPTTRKATIMCMTLSKPVIERPTGEAPADLDIVDITVGDGEEARPGQTVLVHYIGVS